MNETERQRMKNGENFKLKERRVKELHTIWYKLLLPFSDRRVNHPTLFLPLSLSLFPLSFTFSYSPLIQTSFSCLSTLSFLSIPFFTILPSYLLCVSFYSSPHSLPSFFFLFLTLSFSIIFSFLYSSQYSIILSFIHFLLSWHITQCLGR